MSEEKAIAEAFEEYEEIDGSNEEAENVEVEEEESMLSTEK